MEPYDVVVKQWLQILLESQVDPEVVRNATNPLWVKLVDFLIELFWQRIYMSIEEIEASERWKNVEGVWDQGFEWVITMFWTAHEEALDDVSGPLLVPDLEAYFIQQFEDLKNNEYASFLQQVTDEASVLRPPY